MQSKPESAAPTESYASLLSSRLPARIVSKIMILGEDDCWNWQGALTAYGRYGHTWNPGATRENPKVELTHRVVYEALYGPVPQGMNVLHSCDNGVCCNPQHLRVGTQSENLKEASDKGRMYVPGRAARKLTPEQVREIRTSALSDIAAATAFHTTPGNVWHIRKRATYADVED